MFRRIKEYCKFLKSLFLTNIRLLRGMWKLTKLPQPAITVFGGANVAKDSIYAKKAFEIGKKLTEDGYSVITGGGPGIMESANQGAYEAAKEQGLKNDGRKLGLTSLGISLSSFSKEGINPYVQDRIIMKHFFSRKWLLVRYSIGFIIFPGGFGTLDELFEIVTLEQCYKMPRIPIILMNTRYWEPILHWIKSRAIRHGLIKKEDSELIYCTNDVEKAIEIINKYCKSCKDVKHSLYAR